MKPRGSHEEQGEDSEGNEAASEGNYPASEENDPVSEGNEPESEGNYPASEFVEDGESGEEEHGVVSDIDSEDTTSEDNEYDDEVSKREEEEAEVEEEVPKSKGIIETLNEYLESIFATAEEHDEEVEEELTAMYELLWKILSGTLGVIAIVEVEREISFRTEQGLYYSYFKQIVESPTWQEGFNQLKQDNQTEHGRTINIIHRFNILPEIILSAVYRWLSPREAPSVFYVSTVFGLHGVFVATLYITAWYLSGSILAGFISVILFVVHLIDTTRVNYTVPLRESFAVPLLFLQIFLMCTYIRSYKWQRVKLAAIFLLNVTFLLSWQFGPFVLLCQLFCFTSLGRLLLMTGTKVSMLVVVMGISLLVACVVQANPPLVVSSPALSMVLPALVLSFTPSADRNLGTTLRLTIVAAELSLLLLATVLINGSIKIFLDINADSHVYQLLFAKLQMGDIRDFDSRLYMCSDAFDYMDIESLERLCESGLLPLYVVGVIVFLVSTVNYFLRNNPEENMENYTEISSDYRENLFNLLELSREEISYTSEYMKIIQQEIETLEYGTERVIDTTYMGDMKVDPSTEKLIKEQSQTECIYAPWDSSQGQSFIQGRPDLIFFLALSVMWSILATLILRLKVLWMPTVCVLTGVFMADIRIYSSLIPVLTCGKLSSYLPRWFPEFFKMIICFSFVAFIYIKFWGKVASEVWPEEMYEFWDPDTVELMEWVQSYTPPDAVFAGSMQLLAGVKLCTGRHITNHPHYEDSWLRDRTHQVYQIYGREAPEVVYNALKTAGATHIIVEDSICLLSVDSKRPLCRLIDIVDLHNGHIPENGGQGIPALQTPLHGRFCNMVQQKIAEYSRFFSLVMSNKTFRVYRVAVTS
ncbi:C-mannosyltransferase DPY19L3-like [Homarus americanus]|uniref:C-mannosyltransferase DPY19L3-like n=1 Tax=Homarus americanus TaxID=6706 RepID=A0A8J5MLL5_HOMAM|nr:C-mannosyltransferase DPY19L3-like [Homarus americanus]